MLKDHIEVAKGFQTSVNIAYDLHDANKVASFIPTMSSLDIIEDVLLSTAPNSTDRARILIGAYGKGKSHIILVLLSMLFKKDKALFSRLLDKMQTYNSDLYIANCAPFFILKVQLCICSQSNSGIHNIHRLSGSLYRHFISVFFCVGFASDIKNYRFRRFYMHTTQAYNRGM